MKEVVLCDLDPTVVGMFTDALEKLSGNETKVLTHKKSLKSINRNYKRESMELHEAQQSGQRPRTGKRIAALNNGRGTPVTIDRGLLVRMHLKSFTVKHFELSFFSTFFNIRVNFKY